MGPDGLLVPLLSFMLAWGGTFVMRRYALGKGMMDVPNERSSHSTPTPRGGGLAIVIALYASTTAVWLSGLVQAELLWTVVVGGGLVALIGYLDDRHALPAELRLGVHVTASVLAVALIDGELLSPDREMGLPGVLVAAAAVVGVVWTINLCNFMDGIDGIAASQAVFMGGATAILNFTAGGPDGLTLVLAAFAAASCGFLLLNWPPARIFMGDVGSGFMGFTLGALALACDARSPVSIWVWITLGALFIGDATATLLHRIIRGERWYSAHRTHAYQRLARRFGAHLPVTALFIVTNVIVLFPAACFAVARPSAAPIIAASSVLATVGASLLLGAGRPESASGR